MQIDRLMDLNWIWAVKDKLNYAVVTLSAFSYADFHRNEIQTLDIY
jgi:hypothetical protein